MKKFPSHGPYSIYLRALRVYTSFRIFTVWTVAFEFIMIIGALFYKLPLWLLTTGFIVCSVLCTLAQIQNYCRAKAEVETMIKNVNPVLMVEENADE